MKHQTISATEFKAKCLALLSEIDEHGGTLTVTKRGRPLVTVGPAKEKPWKSLRGVMAGKGRIIGDIVNADTSDLWDIVTDPERVLSPEHKS